MRIDPFGFALEKYDPIGRLREKDLGGLAVDAKAKLRDGTEFEGIDGLRTYLLTKKKDVVVRLFCRRAARLCSGPGGHAVGPAADRRDGGGVEQERRPAVGRGAGDRAEPAVSDDPRAAISHESIESRLHSGDRSDDETTDPTPSPAAPSSAASA